MLFGLFKQAGETLTADVREWMGTNYFEASLAGAVGLFIEEATNAFMVSQLKLTDWKATAYKTIHRLVFSALYYFGGKSMFGNKVIPLTMSVFPVAMIFVEAINHLFKVSSPQEAGLLLASKFRKTAKASLSAPVVYSKAITVSPASTPVSSIPAQSSAYSGSGEGVITI